jgi:hypothetical protein
MGKDMPAANALSTMKRGMSFSFRHEQELARIVVVGAQREIGRAPHVGRPSPHFPEVRKTIA